MILHDYYASICYCKLSSGSIYFGTDGIRGTANEPPMMPDIALDSRARL